MTEIENNKNRILFGSTKVLNRNVMVMDRTDWETMIDRKGNITLVNSLAAPLTNVMNEAEVVAVTASGYHAPKPGIEIVRKDSKDDPYIYNIDHYTVVQTFCQHPEYETIVNKAGVVNSPNLQQCLTQYVFVVKNKPNESEDHWAKELPIRIKNALEKGPPSETS